HSTAGIRVFAILADGGVNLAVPAVGELKVESRVEASGDFARSDVIGNFQGQIVIYAQPGRGADRVVRIRRWDNNVQRIRQRLCNHRGSAVGIPTIGEELDVRSDPLIRR